MQFNRYVFDLYLQSTEGKESLEIWTDFLDWQNWKTLNYELLTKQINSSLYISKNTKDTQEVLSLVKKEMLDPLLTNLLHPEDPEESPSTWENWIEEANNLNKEELFEGVKNLWENTLEELLNNDQSDRDAPFEVYFQSIYLSNLYPSFFFPYFFVSQFNLIENLFKEFNLALPELPKARDYKARLNYYFELCDILYYFRQEYQMNPTEFLAFLYGFAGNFIKEKLETDEKPLRVWITGGNKEDYKQIINSTDQSNLLNHWTGNLEAKKSDLQLIYFRTPYSGIGAVSTCLSSGYFDPFDYYEKRVVTAKIKTFQFVTLDELKENEIWKNKSLVKGNMQGVKGQSVTFEEYQELRHLLVQKGENKVILPELESVVIETNLDLQNERDVEIELLEPLLKKLGFKEENWVRQLSVRMGRGERNYPDYALFVDNKKKHEETAKFLWEAKLRIRNQKELRDAFLQAKSYARRLDSLVFGICSVEGIWISTLRDKFEFEKLQFLKWTDLKENQNLQKIKRLFQ
jgi:hypothetical protein